MDPEERDPHTLRDFLQAMAVFTIFWGVIAWVGYTQLTP